MTATAVGICASTGGPSVVEEILRELPADYPLPVLIVQHIATGFGVGFARMLDGRVALPVALAEHGAVARPGVWVAPDDADLTLGPALRMRVGRDAEAAGPHPSADALLRSLAATLGDRAAAVVLTGMGRDGGEGTAAVKAAGGLVLAQDEDSSIIYGMPRAAAQAGARSLAPDRIAATLRDLPYR
jgi:two-component system chemotaxis response regulator CheB